MFQSSPNLSIGCSLIFPPANDEGWFFQSSPQSLGCCWSEYWTGVRFCFNPHPTSRLGAASSVGLFLGRAHAYFNPHPAEMLGATRSYEVSILTQPFSWAQVAVSMILVCFNSRPASRLGELVLSCFNPHLTSCLGATWVRGEFPAHPGIGHPLMTFQSSPNLSAGCSSVLLQFQSSPNLLAGRANF